MSPDENKAIVRRLLEEVWKEGNLAAADDLVAADYIHHRFGLIAAGRAPGIEGLKQRIATARAAFPDLHLTVDDVIGEGDKVAVRYTQGGTHRADFRGVSATGKQVTFTGINVYRLARGKIVEEWTLYDALGLLQQFGVIPAMGHAAG